MGVHTEGNKLVIIIEPQTFYFGLPKNIDKLKHEIDFIIKHNEFLAEYVKKFKIKQLLSKYRHDSNIHECRKK